MRVRQQEEEMEAAATAPAIADVSSAEEAAQRVAALEQGCVLPDAVTDVAN